MLVETFAEGHSFLHTMDTTAKLVAATVFSLCTALLTTLPIALIALVCGMALLCWAKLPAKLLFRRLLIVNGFIAFLWLTLPVSTPGTPIASFAEFTVTQEGIYLSLLITLKSNAIIAAFIALLATSTITDIGAAFAQLHIPQKISLLFLFTWRYIHVIIEEYHRLSTAAALRGFVPSTTRHTYKTYANLIAMILIKSHDRAERVSAAMKLRGFTGTFHSATTQQLRLLDISAAACISCISIIMLGFEMFHRMEVL